MSSLDPRQLSKKHLRDAAGSAVFRRGLGYFSEGRVRLIHANAETASLAVSGTHDYLVEMIEIDGHTEMMCTCPHAAEGHFCKHMVASGLFMRTYLEKRGEDAWKEPFDRALKKKAASRSSPSRPYFLVFSLEGQYGSWILQPYTLNASKVLELTGGSLEEQSGQSVISLIRQNAWLGAQARRVSQSLRASDCINCPPAVVSLANMIRRSEGSGFAYRFYSFTRPIEDYLALLAGTASPLFRGRPGNPLKTPITLWENPGSLRAEIRRLEAGDIALSMLVQVGSETIDLKAGAVDLIADNPLWILSGDNLLEVALERGRDAAAVFIQEPEMLIPRSMASEFLESYLLPLIDLFPVEGDSISWEDVRTGPVKRLYLSENENQLIVRLRFAYGDVELPFDPGAGSVSTRHKQDGSWTLLRVHRDISAEWDVYRSISGARSGLKYLRGTPIENGFTLRASVDIVDFLLKKIPSLVEDGFEIYGEEELASARVNRSKPTLSLYVSSGIDWFDLKAAVRFGDVETSLKEVRRALRKKKRYVKLADGTIGELPAEWVERYRHLFGLGEQTDEGVRLSAHHVTLVDELLGEADSRRSDAEFRQRLKRLKDFKGIPDVALPEGFVGELRPYQKSGYDWLHFLKDFGFGGCLADDMGLGKTIQVLAFLQSLYENGMKGRASLVVLPRSLLFNWRREAETFTPGLRIHEHFGPGRGKNVSAFESQDIVLTTYGTMRRDIQLLRSYDFAYAILDESQAIKNPLSQVSKASRLLNARHRLVMTGTPVENSTFELWSQFAFLNPGLLGGQEYFKREFANPIERRSDESAAATLRKLVYPFILRRTKAQVAPELPPRTERVVYGDMETAQRKQYERTRDYYRGVVLGMIESEGMNDTRMKILEGLLRLRQISNHPSLVDPDYRGKSAKMELLFDLLKTLRAEGHKALVFSQFVQMLGLIRNELDAAGVRYVYLDGQTVNRQAVVDRFQEDEEIPFFLISLRAGGVGLNLTAADYVIHVDPWWNPAVEMQASDRTHRIGQDKPVFVYKMITRGTVEEKILNLQERKRELAEVLISTESSFFKQLTQEDVQVLFS